MEQVSASKTFGGTQLVLKHASAKTGGEMTFAVFLPPAAGAAKVPSLWFLAGLTCTHENAMTKAGAQGLASALGMALVFPDTSPRGDGVADDEAYDLGKGAGFYLDATEAPWAKHFAMESYLVKELAPLLAREFPLDATRFGVTGHSMGGHGALTLAMRHPDLFRSVSAFAPIANPTQSDWGRKQLTAYLGPDETKWAGHDASLLAGTKGWAHDILIDQGLGDDFLALLRPAALTSALSAAGIAHTYRAHAGYDHSYNFVATFMADHLRWHAERL